MKEMQIVLIHRRKFQERPPVISVVDHLLNLGYHPIIITAGINDFHRKKLTEKGISVNVIPFEINKGSFIINAINGAIWGRKARRLVNTFSRNDEILLWIEGNYTFTSLTAKFINQYNHILQHQEFPDPNVVKGRIVMRTLARIMPTALANFAPEYNRACLYRCYLGLKKPLFLLPNKASFVPTNDQLSLLKPKYESIISQIGGRKIILYQGILSGERNLEGFIKAAKRLDGNEYVTVLLGKATKQLEIYKTIDPNLIHINYIPAPDYLVITSMAYIGFLSYAPSQINLIYCAPNKIFEYGAFGIPMIGNDIPGLRYTIQDNGLGLVCNVDSEEDVLEKLNIIISNYSIMSKKALDYYESVDNKETIRVVMNNIERRDGSNSGH